MCYKRTPICCIRVRTVDISDLREVYDIEIKSFGKDAYPFEILLYYYIISREYFIVLECINRIVGYAIGVIEHVNGKRGHVISIAIHPLYRRMGLGKILMNELEKRLYSSGAKYIYLEVKETNNVAINLYKSLGYVIIKRIRKYYGCEDGFLMVKQVGKEHLS